ncbi:DUF6418 domain-containing protein [Bradyrhizobium sp. AUGA SZCCT0283]|uniref:DUF6418 domain-containing protein n=1 Tax=Bradyrhizobium sp. AUGA SZCCT0283 TaxID=2807671 RepID=UPI001BA93E38|nr:DUF6418 domain-containing protein [Bradyrhizobium sp. AUGA SZCCT0283]MBR1277658.1 hypothetical protein [Bradyrhizobium sp. AUGA SZCCT0283]
MTASGVVSDSLLAAALSVTAVVVFLAAALWIAVKRPGLGMIFFFVLFAFAWRLASVLYIDVFGPLFSDQLALEIGSGVSVLPIAMSQGIVVIALLFSFRRERVRQLVGPDESGLASRLPPGRFSLFGIAFLAAALFVVALWLELLMRGPIPLFAGIERFDYSRLHGGPLHHRLLEWGPMLAFQLGIFFSVPLLHNRPSDWRFGVLFGTVILYLFLAGHRFSSLYAYTSFFIMPLGAVLIGRQAKSPSLGEMLSRRILRWLAVAAVPLSVLIAAAVVYSYVVVRGEGGELLAKLSQRILVQQGEMWWMTFERVFLRGDWDGMLAAYKLFVDPFDPSRNSTMQFLMEQALPVVRAHFIIAQGSAFTGGWPEVFFELGGPVGGFVLVALSAIVFSEFMFLMTRCIVQERFATCFFLTPILFALSIMIVSGMVNSFIEMTFLVKVVSAVVVYVTEDKWRSNMLFSRPSAGSEDEAFS